MIGVRLRAIIVKELWAILRDPRTRITLLAPPIMQLLVFGLATTLEVKNIALGVLDRDGGPWSQEVIERVQGSPNVARVVSLASEDDLRTAIGRQRVIAALRFDPGFSADVASGRGGRMSAVFDGRRSNTAQIVAGYIDRIAAEASASVAHAKAPLAPRGSITINWFNPNLDYPWFTMPSLIAVIAAITTMSMVAQSVARERELGTFDQLMVSPLRVHEILIGKMVPPM
ncbi:MAG TPA: ABC transporter permease, partial [Anaeromyxobacteraceae bacterium]|nr:ABC transporter permease [Anaeromyxobacteraceae bacterium]